MEKENPIEEAKRCMDNAKLILRDKAIEDGIDYKYKKYTRMAGKCMWNGCQIALSHVLGIKLKKREYLVFKDFMDAANNRDMNLSVDIREGYYIMSIYMGVDGTKDVNVVKSGLNRMKNIIDWCEANSPK